MIDHNRLLILDDEIEVAKLVAMIARKQGFEVQIFTNIHAFYKAVDDWLPTHITIDLAMPYVDGVQVLSALADLTCKAGIILISGLGQRVLDSAHRAGNGRGLNIIGSLSKPFRKSALSDLLSQPIVHNGTRSQEEVVARFHIEDSEIERALQDNQFVLHYQPKMYLDENKVAGFEALIRWQHPEHGLVYPNHFIARLEQSQKLTEMTYLAFEHGLNWLSSLGSNNSFVLEFNVSAGSLNDPLIVEFLEQECIKRHIATERIVIEVTESNAINNFNNAIDLLTRLRIKGFHLAIDDFGTGYSSMRQLARLPFSELKIDQSFVKPMAQSVEARKIVESTIKLAQELDMTTVAEGVEDLQTMEMLRDMGCNFVQGYLISKPMPEIQATHWLAQRLG